MKNKHFKALSLFLCLLMIAGATLVPVAAEATELTGNDLLAAYGLTCNKPDNVSSAKISQNGENSFLEVGFISDSTAKYPALQFDNVPTDMTEYTVKADFVVVTDQSNKLSYFTFGKFKCGSSTKTGNFGIRTLNNKISGQNVLSGDLLLTDIDGMPADKQTSAQNTVHTLEATVSSKDTLTISLKVNGIDITDRLTNNATSFVDSTIMLQAWHGFSYGFDNLYIVNNATGEVVFNEDFEEESTAPTQEGKVFAGWYRDSAFTTPAEAGADVGFPKFVNEGVLGLRTQLTAGTTAESASTDLRLITSVDGLDYAEAGFVMTCNGVTVKKASQTVYTTIRALGDDVTAKSQFVDESAYFVTYTITDIPQSAFNSEIAVTPYWVTADGVVAMGEAVTVTVNGVLA